MKHQASSECQDCVEYGSEFCADCLKEKRVNEEAMTTADAGIPHDTKDMGPRFKTYRVLDKRRKKLDRPRVLRRFKEFT